MSRRRTAVYFVLALITALLCLLPLVAVIARLHAETGGQVLQFLSASGILRKFLLPAAAPLVVAAFLFAYLRRSNGDTTDRRWAWAWLAAVIAGGLLIAKAQFVYVKLAVLLLLAVVSLHLAAGRHGGTIFAWLRRGAAALTYVLFILLLAEPVLIVVELGLLRSGFSAADARLKDYGHLFHGGFGPGGGLAPGLDITMKDGYGRPVAARTNALGFRTDHELILPKPEGERRILLLGDSFSVGYRIDQAQMIGSVLERELAMRMQSASDDSVRVYAAHTLDQYEALRWMQRYGRGNDFDADLIVIGICEANDVHGSYFHALADESAAQRAAGERAMETAMLPEHAYEPSDNDFVSNYGRRLRLLDLALHSYGTRITPMPYDHGRPGALRFWEHGAGLYLREEDDIVQRVWTAYGATLRAIQATAPRDVPVVFAVFPMRFQVSDAEWDVTRRYWWLRDAAFDPMQVNAKIRALCDTTALLCVDLLPEFRERDGEVLYYPNDFHWNAAGNAAAGAALAKRLAPFLE